MNRPSPHSQCALLVVKSVCSISKILVVWQSFTSVFFFLKGLLIFFLNFTLHRKYFTLELSLLPQKNIDQSQKKMVRKRFLYFFLDRYVYGLSLLFLKQKNQHLWRARKKIVDNQKRHELSFFFLIISKKKKNKRLTKKINLIFGNRRRQLKKCILVPRLIHSSYRLYKETENSGNFWIFSSFGQRNAPLFFWLIYLFFFWGGEIFNFTCL